MRGIWRRSGEEAGQTWWKDDLTELTSWNFGNHVCFWTGVDFTGWQGPYPSAASRTRFGSPGR